MSDVATGEPAASQDRIGASPWRGLAVDAAIILGAFLVAAVLAGVLWPHLVGSVEVVRTRTGTSTDEIALSRQFDSDGWFSVLAGALGVVLGLALTRWRTRDQLATVLLVVASAFVAAWVMSRVGTALGPPDPTRVLAHAQVGDSAPDQVKVRADAVYLVWPIGATLGAVLALLLPGGDRPR